MVITVIKDGLQRINKAMIIIIHNFFNLNIQKHQDWHVYLFIYLLHKIGRIKMHKKQLNDKKQQLKRTKVSELIHWLKHKNNIGQKLN